MESPGTPLKEGTKKFLMNAGRTTKQGQQISSGKDRDDYKATVGTMHMHPQDMKEIGVPTGSIVLVRSPWGEATFKCVEGKVPEGMIFVPYGPPTCRLMGQQTDGTGMPLSKGWEVEVELLEAPPAPAPAPPPPAAAGQ
jgi:formylmethanofuran dehydrogenase subunit D